MVGWLVGWLVGSLDRVDGILDSKLLLENGIQPELHLLVVLGLEYELSLLGRDLEGILLLVGLVFRENRFVQWNAGAQLLGLLGAERKQEAVAYHEPTTPPILASAIELIHKALHNLVQREHWSSRYKEVVCHHISTRMVYTNAYHSCNESLRCFIFVNIAPVVLIDCVIQTTIYDRVPYVCVCVLVLDKSAHDCLFVWCSVPNPKVHFGIGASLCLEGTQVGRDLERTRSIMHYEY